MKDSKTLKAILLISGLIAAGFGAAIAFTPVEFSATSGIDLAGKPSLLSETRSAGGALLAAGALIVSGAFVRRLAFTATVVAGLMYLAYGASRILSMVADGMPHAILVQATVLELGVGLIALFALAKYRDPEGAAAAR